MVFQLKQHDTKSAMKATLKAQGNPVDLNGVDEVRFLMRKGSTIVIDKPVNFAEDKLSGKVWFPFESDETANVGLFKGEFTVYFSDGREETFPNAGYILVEIISSNRGGQ